VEVGVLEKAEQKKANKPATVVAKAKERMGEGGYHLLHNNCEHFVNECLFNERFSEQENFAKQKWFARNLVHVYIACVPPQIHCENIFPDERKREIERVRSERARAEKIAVWQLLEVALQSTYSLSLQQAELYKKHGKWNSRKCYLSLTHSDGLVAVALSNVPVGVDLETKAHFSTTARNGEEKFLKKICTAHEAQLIAQHNSLSPIELWTRKESLFKREGKGFFIPSQIESDVNEVQTTFGCLNDKEYCLAVATALRVEPLITVKELVTKC
jgi:phosphopantetheinyl transferase